MTITKLGRYDIVRVLGKGAMGLVYEARDPNLDRRVAIKTIKVENLSTQASADYEARFRTEARSAARLQHPNIVSVYDSERHGDVAYLVMEFVQGDDLKKHLDAGERYSLEQSLSMVRDLLAALDYAHRQNIVHRDVKPANLLVEASGRVKLADFGVARIEDSGEATRTKGSMVGTLKYMSPEQVQGQMVDARADLFAAGVVLYQLLTGRRPFDADGEFAIIHQIVSEDPPAPGSINAKLPSALDAVLAKALAKRREDRYASAREFLLAMQEAGGHASDPTIVPPFVPSNARAGSGAGVGALRSQAGGSGAGRGASGESSGTTVTQELELVYWKDVKESDDVQDLQGFLDRFPLGIYADLARRRLKKLRDRDHGEHSSTQTATVAMSPRSSASDQTADLASASILKQARWPQTQQLADDATRDLADDVTVQQARPSAAQPMAPEQASASGAKALAHTTASARPDERPPAAPTAAQPHLVARHLSATEPDPAAGEPAPARSRGPWIAVAAVAVLLVAAGVVKMLAGGAAQPTTADVALPPVAPAAVVVKPAPVGAPPGAVAAARPASRTMPGTTEKAASKAAPGPAGSTQTIGATPGASTPAASVMAAATSVPVAKAAPARVAADNATVPALSGPAQACDGRILMGFQLCMNEQCAKPAFANLPVCVERRAAEKALRSPQSGDNRN